MTQPFVVSMKITGDGSGASAAVKQVVSDVENLQRKVAQAATGGGPNGPVETIPRILGLGPGTDGAARGADVKAYGQELDNLRAKFNPLFAAQHRQAQALAEINRAQRLGAISAQEASAAILREKAAYDALTRSIAANTNSQAANAGGRADRAGSFHTANIAAQFQDIGVTSAMGMSPLQIALQQGTQLSAVLGAQGAAGSAALLRNALFSIISPVSLLTIGLVGLTAMGIQWFGSMLSGSESTEDALERHAERIAEITRGYGDAEKAATDYIEKATRLPESVVASDISRDREAALERYAGLVRLVQQEQSGLNDTILSFGNMGVGPRLPEGFKELHAAVDQAGISASSTSREINDLIAEVREIADTHADRQLRQAAAALEVLLMGARDTAVEVESLGVSLDNLPSTVTIRLRLMTENFSSAMEDLRDLAPELRTAGEVARAEAETAFQRASGAAQSYGQLNAAVAQYEATIAALDEEERRAEAKKAATAAARAAKQKSEYERAIESIRDRTEAQEIEAKVIGLSTFAAERMRVQLELENAAREDAIGLTSERIAEIAAEANAHARLAARIEEINEAYEFGKSTFNSFFSDIRQGLMEGASGWEIFGNAASNALNSIADRAMGMFADGIFDMLFGAVMGGLGGGFSPQLGQGLTGASVFGGGGGSYGIPGLATGGTVRTGGVAWVGEQGPELLRLPQGAEVVPHRQSMQMAANSNTTINVNVDARGAERGAGPAIAEAVRRALPDAMRDYEKNPYRRAG